MRTIALTSILFLVLAAIFWGCYSGKYEEIDPSCAPNVPVVLNGNMIPEWRITRNDSGCITGIYLGVMGISDSNCLAEIETWSVELVNLSLNGNYLTRIDLSPLSSCMNLERFILGYNNLTSIDITPLWDLDSLEYLYISNNPLDSASCEHVCDFIDEHANCDVATDCTCP